jgi:hypothetical protein
MVLIPPAQISVLMSLFQHCLLADIPEVPQKVRKQALYKSTEPFGLLKARLAGRDERIPKNTV